VSLYCIRRHEALSVVMLYVVAPCTNCKRLYRPVCWNKSSHLAPALGVTKFLTEIDMILVTLWATLVRLETFNKPTLGVLMKPLE